MKKVLGIIALSCLTSVGTFVFANKYLQGTQARLVTNEPGSPIAQFASYSESALPDGGYVNLEEAAERSSKAVVHIKTETKSQVVQYRNPFGNDFFDQFFGGGQQFFQQIPPQQSSGSGVIISGDGYIVTNNHVVDGAEEVTVILNNKKSLKAKVIGKDPSTDLALIKVNESNLPFISFGNSDDVKLGQWVLAVGYPLTLETTVTAGIVSAKYRNIGINQSKSGANAIESFIQTDAAVNPGNSGGALVNARGELIGINSAIASPTGSYAGYSFAIPANIVKKVTEDLRQFGNVQRAYLGIGYIDSKQASAEKIEELGLDKVDGVYIEHVEDGSSADEAGLKEGDFITRLGNKDIKTGPQLQEQLSQFRPGDRVPVQYLRSGKTYEVDIKLKNRLGNTSIVKNEAGQSLGVNMRDLTKEECNRLRVKGGVYITDIKPGGWIARQTRMKKTFVITQVNDTDIKSTIELEKILNGSETEFQLGGLYPSFQGVYYYMIKKE